MEPIPERPLTPFFIFRKELAEKGAPLSAKDCGKKWQAMTKDQRKPYTDAYNKERERYDAYLEAEGIPKKTSAAGKKVTSYKVSKVTNILEKNKKHKEMSESICRGITKVIEAFVRDLAYTASNVMKSDGKMTVSVEVLQKAMESKKYRQLIKMKSYEDILAEANKALEQERTKRRKSRTRKYSEGSHKKDKRK